MMNTPNSRLVDQLSEFIDLYGHTFDDDVVEMLQACRLAVIGMNREAFASAIDREREEAPLRLSDGLRRAANIVRSLPIAPNSTPALDVVGKPASDTSGVSTRAKGSSSYD